MTYFDELKEIEATLKIYSDYIVEIFDEELRNRDDQIETLCVLIHTDDNFMNWISAYYELVCAREELEEYK